MWMTPNGSYITNYGKKNDTQFWAAAIAKHRAVKHCDQIHCGVPCDCNVHFLFTCLWQKLFSVAHPVISWHVKRGAKFRDGELCLGDVCQTRESDMKVASRLGIKQQLDALV